MSRAWMISGRSKGISTFLGLALAVGLALWLAGRLPDCKDAARPLIAALEESHRINGHYPETLKTLVHAKLLRSLPRPTWNLGVQHMDDFEYSVEPDLDYYCLEFAEAPIFGGIGPPHWDGVYYVSFRENWSRSEYDQHLLPVERAGERFRQSRSSTDLQLLVKKLQNSRSRESSIFWEDIAAAFGPELPCSIEGQPGFMVEAGDDEAAAIFFATRRANTLSGDKSIVVKIFERFKDGAGVKWREVFRDENDWWGKGG